MSGHSEVRDAEVTIDVTTPVKKSVVSCANERLTSERIGRRHRELLG